MTTSHSHHGGTVAQAAAVASSGDSGRFRIFGTDAKVMTMATKPEKDPSELEAVALAAAPYLTRGVELTELLGALVDAVVNQIGCDKGTLYLVDAAARTVTSIIADVPEQIGRIQLVMGQGIAGAVAATKSPIRIVDAQQDARFDPRFDRATGYVTKSVLAIPIFDHNADVIGVLQLLNKRSGAFTGDDESYATTLSKHAGSVLDPSRD